MKKQNILRLVAIASIIYTLRFFSGAFKGITEGTITADFSGYPVLVFIEFIILISAALVPLVSTFSGSLLKNKIIRYFGILSLVYAILSNLNFFFQMGIEASLPHIKVTLRLASWIALAYLTHWK